MKTKVIISLIYMPDYQRMKYLVYVYDRTYSASCVSRETEAVPEHEVITKRVEVTLTVCFGLWYGDIRVVTSCPRVCLCVFRLRSSHIELRADTLDINPPEVGHLFPVCVTPVLSSCAAFSTQIGTFGRVGLVSHALL